jgi:fumarylacetoacetate (FAA) hydrolase family protein
MPQAFLPSDLDDALLIGRVWRPAPIDGPSVVVVRRGEVFDITPTVATTADLFDRDDAVEIARHAPGESLGPVDALIRASLDSSTHATRLLAPCDVQAIKACGVTFAVSLLERVIEEHAGGDASKAQETRSMINELIGADLSKIKPGSEAAGKLPNSNDAARGRNTWKSVLVRMPKYFPNLSRCRRSDSVPMWVCIRRRSGTTPNRKSCWP